MRVAERDLPIALVEDVSEAIWIPWAGGKEADMNMVNGDRREDIRARAKKRMTGRYERKRRRLIDQWIGKKMSGDELHVH